MLKGMFVVYSLLPTTAEANDDNVNGWACFVS